CLGVPNLHREAIRTLRGMMARGLGQRTYDWQYSNGYIAFLSVFGLTYLLLLLLLTVSVIFSLPGVIKWFKGESWVLLATVFTTKPFTVAWWTVMSAQLRNLLLSVGIIAIILSLSAQTIRKVSGRFKPNNQRD
ncbi:MAG: hypothetical protein ACRD63_16320, partial [Pyrinomonadaceae bacterium]